MQTSDFPLSHLITARHVRVCAQLWPRRFCPPGTWSELGHSESRSAWQLLLAQAPPSSIGWQPLTCTAASPWPPEELQEPGHT